MPAYKCDDTSLAGDPRPLIPVETPSMPKARSNVVVPIWLFEPSGGCKIEMERDFAKMLSGKAYACSDSLDISNSTYTVTKVAKSTTSGH